MEYEKIINILYNIMNKPFKFRTRNWVKINDEAQGAYNNNNNNNNHNHNHNNNIEFKTTMIRSGLFDYSYAYILVKGTITVPSTAAQGAAVNNTN